LQISTGAPLLFIKRIMRSNDRAVQVVEAHYRPDQFEYRLQLKRKQDGEEEIWSDGP
jgi:GntR family transcriptional regulator